MGFVAFGNKHFPKKAINEETFRKIAQYLGISPAEVDKLMADNPRCVYIHRAPDAGKTGGGGSSGGGGGGSGTGS